MIEEPATGKIRVKRAPPKAAIRSARGPRTARRPIRSCIALQAIVALGLLASVLASWPEDAAPQAAPPAAIEAPPSFRYVEEPMLIAPDARKPRPHGNWM